MLSLVLATLVLVAAGLFTGFMLGLTGAGGSVLTLPAIVVLLGLDAHQAVAASLVSVGATAALGTVNHWRHGHVHLGHAGIFALSGVVFAALGGHAGRLLPDDLLMTLFALLMLYVAARMVRAPAEPTATAALAGRPKLAAYGAGVGLLSGFLGIGGGFLIMPALCGPGGLPIREAIGTGLAVIAINSVAALAGALSALDGVPWDRVTPFVLGSLAGGWLGARYAARWSANRLVRVFSVLVAAVGVWMLLRYGSALIARVG